MVQEIIEEEPGGVLTGGGMGGLTNSFTHAVNWRISSTCDVAVKLNNDTFGYSQVTPRSNMDNSMLKTAAYRSGFGHAPQFTC